MTAPSQARAIMELQARAASLEAGQQAAMTLAAERAAKQDAMAVLVQEVHDAILGAPPEGGPSFMAEAREALRDRDAVRRLARWINNAAKLVGAVAVLFAAWMAFRFGGKP